MLRIIFFVSAVVAIAAARESIVFNGVVQDSSFAVGEKLNVEILETGEALQTTVGTPFSVVLPEDTLWNVCVTNSDTLQMSGTVYSGNENFSVFDGGNSQSTPLLQVNRPNSSYDIGTLISTDNAVTFYF